MEPNPVLRPTMHQVVRALDGAVAVDAGALTDKNESGKCSLIVFGFCEQIIVLQ